MKNTLSQIAKKLLEAETVLVYPHVLLDGDSLGSSVALCCGLRKIGKDAYILIEDEVPSYLKFLDKDYCISAPDTIISPDISIALDCSDTGRFEKRQGSFKNGKITINVDHHITNHQFADLNYVDVKASSTGEIVFQLLQGMNIEMDSEIVEALYVAIATDTGNFQYTNTTKNTHLIVAELFDIGINLEKISVELYQNIRVEQLNMTHEVLGTIEMFCHGMANIAIATQQMLRESGATMDETEGTIEMLRSIRGIEISCFLKEISENQVKVSFRSKSYGNVAEIAQKFHGGGHKKAAGCTLYKTILEVKTLVMREICAHLESIMMDTDEKEIR